MSPTQEKVYPLPNVGLYSAEITRVLQRSKNINGEEKHHLLLIIELDGTEQPSTREEGKMERIAVFKRLPLPAKFVKFEITDPETGQKGVRVTKLGEFLEKLFGPLPVGTRTEDVDPVALGGVKLETFITHNEYNGKTYANADVVMPPKDAIKAQFNEDRKALVIKS